MVLRKPIQTLVHVVEKKEKIRGMESVDETRKQTVKEEKQEEKEKAKFTSPSPSTTTILREKTGFGANYCCGG